MNLLTKSCDFLVWHSRVLQAFLSAAFWETLFVVFASLTARIGKVAAFMLPLKVLLLAGSPSVPKYFPFVSPDQKLEWIIALTVLAFAAYGVNLFCEAVVHQLSGPASARVLQGANEMTVFGGQETAAQTYYARIIEVAAAVLFVLAGLLVLFFLSTAVFVFLVVAAVGQLLFSSAILRVGSFQVHRLKNYVESHASDYIQILSSISFLGGFLVLLFPFLTGGAGNILLTIVSFVILRQVVSAGSGATKDAVKLNKSRHRIDALVFRESQLHAPENKTAQAFRDVFSKNGREHIVSDKLKELTKETASPQVLWIDSDVPRVKLFAIIPGGGATAGQRERYQLQVYAQPYANQLKNEAFLFEHIRREELNAPEVLARFPVNDFDCQVCKAGTGRAVKKAEWPSAKEQLLLQAWSVTPPASLVTAYCASHRLLHARLNEDLVARLEVAADSRREREIYARLCRDRPRVCWWIERLPLYVYNPDLTIGNTVTSLEGAPMVMTWGRWTLEPLGGGLKNGSHEESLCQALPRIASLRNEPEVSLGEAAIRMAGRAAKLEALIAKERYASALKEANVMLKFLSELGQASAKSAGGCV